MSAHVSSRHINYGLYTPRSCATRQLATQQRAQHLGLGSVKRLRIHAQTNEMLHCLRQLGVVTPSSQLHHHLVDGILKVERGAPSAHFRYETTNAPNVSSWGIRPPRQYFWCEPRFVLL